MYPVQLFQDSQFINQSEGDEGRRVSNDNHQFITCAIFSSKSSCPFSHGDLRIHRPDQPDQYIPANLLLTGNPD
ncbi:MAG: hypothetical protein D3916_02530 [Candidatus Electrothrix sp. MAN1_4]|nr:hypothetical protein [Candidatus Electrothrix sp. MAN1_4]